MKEVDIIQNTEKNQFPSEEFKRPVEQQQSDLEALQFRASKTRSELILITWTKI